MKQAMRIRVERPKAMNLSIWWGVKNMYHTLANDLDLVFGQAAAAAGEEAMSE